MDFQTCVRERRSIRKFQERPVDSALIENIVATAALAPSWKNSQTTRYIAISNAALKDEIAESCVMGYAWNQNIIKSAPMLLLITTVSPRSGFERDGSPSTSKGTHWESFDAGVATQTLCLAAHEAGLGSVILGIYDEAKVMEVAHTPEGQKVSALLAIGYPAEAPAMRERKGVDELLCFVE